RAIQRYYKRDSDIIFAPVLGAPEDYQPVPKENFFLLVSRLEPWKRLESTMDAFRKLNERLIIIGDGPHRETLQRRAAKNIKSVGRVTAAELSAYYARARALIQPTAIEYGLTPIEANAHGTPAICLGVDGALETMISYDDSPANATAIFYSDPTAECISE